MATVVNIVNSALMRFTLSRIYRDGLLRNLSLSLTWTFLTNFLVCPCMITFHLSFLTITENTKVILSLEVLINLWPNIILEKKTDERVWSSFTNKYGVTYFLFHSVNPFPISRLNWSMFLRSPAEKTRQIRLLCCVCMENCPSGNR